MSEPLLPAGFVVDDFEREFHYPAARLAVLWRRLQRRETFTEGQLFPYRVEFEAPAQVGEFAPGERNIHHGPLLSVHGVIGEVTPRYRSLHYAYGSYVLSFRLVRPVLLEFRRDEQWLKLRLRAQVRPWFRPVWRALNQCLWTGFRLSL